MTSFLRSSALKGIFFAGLGLALAGCGCSSHEDGDGAPEAAPEWHPDDVPAIQTKAQEAFSKGDWAEAEKAYSRLAFDESLPAEVRSVGWTGKGIIALARLGEAGVPEETADIAHVNLLTALVYDPRNASARFHLGYLYRNAFGFQQSALDQFGMFIALSKDAPDDPHVAKAKEIAAQLKDEIAEARARRPGADKRNQAACAAALKRAAAAAAKGNVNEARAEYGKALAADAFCFEAADRLAASWMTDRSAEGRERAYKYACIATTLRTTNLKTLSTAASLATRLRRPMAAAKLWSRAVAANPTDRTALDGLVSALSSAGIHSRAKVYRRYRDALPKGK